MRSLLNSSRLILWMLKQPHNFDYEKRKIMKPIIVDLKDISDSTEVYDSKPNRFVPYTIYIICAILAIALIWMYLFRMDIVVKADSVFRGDDDSTAVSCAVTGKITKMSVKDGQYVNEGDELYEVDIENLGSTIEDYKSKLDSVQRRLDMLNAYQKSLDGDNSEFDAMSDNQYYSEFKDRKELLNTSIDAGKEKDKTGEVYDENITVINDSIDKYNEKINKLKDVKQCIVSRNNTFDQNDTYYYSIVKSYISSYDYTALQYDNKKDETTMDSSQLAEVDTEKNQALSNLESNEISTIEQQIETANEQIESLKSNISSVELQKKQTENSNNTDESDIKILTEKGNVSAEILTYEDKKQEYEAYLKDYDIKNNNCTIKAGSSGYFYTNKEISNGTYIQEGDSIGQIYPKEQSGYFAQVYVENSDIAKIKPDQEVKFEMASYPSSEYGYFTGTVKENIRFGKLDATDEEIIAAAKLANADGFIRRLPDGYDTMITGDGANLSQGQRQLLAIARAAVADPPVLILDEATSSIDTRTERIIQESMDRLMHGRTTFVIAHRLSTVRNSDCIMVLEQGRIIERGTHDQLIEEKGKYYQLYTGNAISA